MSVRLPFPCLRNVWLQKYGAFDRIMSVGILAGLHSPMLGYTLRAMLDAGVSVSAILMDSRGFSAAEMERWKDPYDRSIL